MFTILYYLIPIIVTIWAIAYLKLPAIKILLLSILPIFLYSLYSFFSIVGAVIADAGVYSIKILLYPFYHTFYIYMFTYPMLITAALLTVVAIKYLKLNLYLSMVASSIFGLLSAYLLGMNFIIRDLYAYTIVAGPLSLLIIEFHSIKILKDKYV